MVLPLKPALPILAIPIGDFHNKIESCRSPRSKLRPLLSHEVSILIAIIGPVG